VSAGDGIAEEVAEYGVCMCDLFLFLHILQGNRLDSRLRQRRQRAVARCRLATSVRRRLLSRAAVALWGYRLRWTSRL